jgi:hypothetical protein
MRLVKLVGEHTIDVDLLPEAPLVLDAGCRTFNFCEEIFALRPKARIIAIDPGPDIEIPDDSRIKFIRCALMEVDQCCKVWLKMAGCESVTSRTPVPGWQEVAVAPFRNVLKMWGPYFDLIKFDCEGAEFDILKNWPGRCATQINIEFHDNMVSPDGKGLPQSYFEELFHVKLSDYRVIQNEPDSLGIHADALLVATSHV